MHQERLAARRRDSRCHSERCRAASVLPLTSDLYSMSDACIQRWMGWRENINYVLLLFFPRLNDYVDSADSVSECMGAWVWVNECVCVYLLCNDQWGNRSCVSSIACVYGYCMVLYRKTVCKKPPCTHSYLWIYCIYKFIYWGYLLFNLFMIMTCKAADSCFGDEIAADVFPCFTCGRILVVAKFYFSEQCVDVLLCV